MSSFVLVCSLCSFCSWQCRSDLGPEVGYEAIGVCDSTLPTVAVWAKATQQDTPAAAAASAQGDSALRSDTEEVSVCSLLFQLLSSSTFHRAS